ncbi:hypothetical protein GWI33_014843, partial [Rhynchophorus ferrugineus]
AVLDSVKDLCV